ncbi:hypothetical protein [Gracilimonas tropica]|uniref:hypothetical protein n=1 Tax=Gracilimonas tropica TaxID=454600 RepID=UPI0003797CA5|nr:hypothetical protein [Gracilimonas tropica]
MKFLLAILIIVHGLIHILGFLKGFNLADIEALKLPISKTGGLLWGLTTFALIISSVLLILDVSFWWKLTLAGLALSQVLIFCSWEDAKFGSIANLLILAGIIYMLFKQ